MTDFPGDVPGDVFRRRIDAIKRRRPVEITATQEVQDTVELTLDPVEIAQEPVAVQTVPPHDGPHAPQVIVALFAHAAHRDRVNRAELPADGQLEHIASMTQLMPPKSSLPLMLSVSGARGIVGESMTPAVAGDFAAAFGSFALAARTGETSGEHRTVCLGRDTRPSSEMLSAAAAAGLAGVGARVVDLGVAATPTIGVMVDELEAAGGMVITASHNPVQWNGLKCITAGAMAPPPADTDEILRRFRERDFDQVLPAALAPGTHDDRGHRVHVERVLAQVDVEPIRSASLRVVLDSNNGAGATAGRMLLEALGCEVVAVNDTPCGNFAHDPEPLQENLVQLARVTAAENAAVGFGQDPDADRLAIVDERGTYLGEEYTMVLAARRMLQTHGAGHIAVNLSTSRMIDDLAARHPGAVVHRTPVGEAHVVVQMKRCGALIGGEGNGGVILPSVCWIRDSLGAMALVLALLADARRPLSDLVAEMPRYVLIKHRIDLDARHDAAALARRVTEHFAGANTSTLDGVRVDLDDGWVHLRASNTEPILRVIAEAATRQRARQLIDEVVAAAGV